MSNERTTEDLVRRHLNFGATAAQVVEEQTSASPRVRRALSAASKAGLGAGKPEFIVTFPDEAPNLILVIECKADPARHESPSRDRYADFAVDGALLYAAHLSRQYDVIALAVSGTSTDHLKVSAFRQLKGSGSAEPLQSPHGWVDRLLPVAELRRLLTYDPAIRARTHAELMTFSRTLHDYMRDHARLSEPQKPLVVSAILLALRDPVFKQSWRQYKPRDQARELYRAVDRATQDAGILEQQREIILAAYSFIQTHPELSKTGAGRGGKHETPLYDLVADIDEHVSPFTDTYTDVDVIGQFYGEFLRYTGGDSRGLGIVLTPRHLTELFVRIADVGPNDTVVDTCAGTGGFLISALSEMDVKAGADPDVHRRIREHQLIGVEQQPEMFALAAANMILRGDGKSNLYRGDCFDATIVDRLTNGVEERHARPNIGLINPPYSQKREGTHELDFVDQMLDVLSPKGLAVAVVPMSCAIAPHASRDRILSKHTLVASMSLPNDLFVNIGTVTCALVFRAHQPHVQSPQATWFGYWKDDGFVKTKNRGRVDLHGKWASIREGWLKDFHSRTVVPGSSVATTVTAKDEWCAEAYMETDYSALTRRDFELTLRRYAMFRLVQAEDQVAEEQAANAVT